MEDTLTLDAKTLELFERLKPELPIRGSDLPGFVSWATSDPSHSLDKGVAYTFETYLRKGIFSQERFWPTIERLTRSTNFVLHLLNEVLITNWYLEPERLAERAPSLVEGYSLLPPGVPIRAIADGVVVSLEGPHESYNQGYNEPSIVRIQHGGPDGVKSSYVHILAKVENGQHLKKGEVIGLTRELTSKLHPLPGYTGLHFLMVNANREHIDPVKVFPELNVDIRRGQHGRYY